MNDWNEIVDALLVLVRAAGDGLGWAATWGVGYLLAALVAVSTVVIVLGAGVSLVSARKDR